MNPIKVDITKNTWTKIATASTSGVINLKEWQADRYYQTYRVTGDPAPTGDYNEDTSVVTLNSEISIAAIEPIDVYMYCIDFDGSVVVAI